MDRNILSLKRKLGLLATIIVFLITLLVGLGFISYKYFRSYNDTLSNIRTYENAVNRLSFSGAVWTNIRSNPAYKDLFKKFFIATDADWGLRYNNSPYIEDAEIRDILKHSRKALSHHDCSYQNDGYFFSCFTLKNGDHLISITFLSYSDIDYLADVSIYSGSLLVFSLFIYFVAFAFVSRIMKSWEENMESMRYFVHAASHELKTPFAAISSSVQLLKEMKKYDEEVVQDLETETQKSGNLINSLLELSNIGEHSVSEEVHISEIVYEVLRDLDVRIQERGIQVKIDLVDDCTVLANRSYVYMFISNLISNAIKYNNPGGDIHVLIDVRKLRIRDTGIGIDEKSKKNIFDIFYRASSHRKNDGLGLGLAIVKKIADLYGWRIRVHSRLHSGTEFEITF